MIKSKKTHIIYRSIYLLIGLVGIIGSFGTFRGIYNQDWYLYYTNISNYFCIFTVLALLINDIKVFKNGEKEGLSTLAPLFRFCISIMILVTFLVYNILLNHPFKVEYWTDPQSLIMHLILPVMFIVDYMLFSKHRSVNVFAPLYACIIPLIYVLFILIRAEVYLGTGRMVYPYFFLNVQYFGYGGVALWLLALMAVFVGLGYALWVYDKLVKNEEGKFKFDFSSLPKPKPEEPVVETIEENQTEENTSETSNEKNIEDEQNKEAKTTENE